MSISALGYTSIMAPHRDWTRHGVGRALLWWPFVAFVLVALFPALVVPVVVGSGLSLALVGFVGGAVFRRRRASRLGRARRALAALPTTIVPTAVAPEIVTAVTADPESRDERRDAIPAAAPQASDDDAEGDHPADEPNRRAA